MRQHKLIFIRCLVWLAYTGCSKRICCCYSGSWCRFGFRGSWLGSAPWESDRPGFDRALLPQLPPLSPPRSLHRGGNIPARRTVARAVEADWKSRPSAVVSAPGSEARGLPGPFACLAGLPRGGMRRLWGKQSCWHCWVCVMPRSVGWGLGLGYPTQPPQE